MIIYIVILIIILIILICCFSIKDNFGNTKRKTILTYTSFLDFKNRYDVFTQSIDSILKYHSKDELKLIDKFIIINEYSDKSLNDWKQMIEKKYPFIEFIQKEKHQRGQVYSLNMILDMIKPYDYWFHIEESWYCIKPFISKCIDIMSKTNITQLQINMNRTNNIPSWLDLPKDRYTCNQTNDYCIIKPPKNLIKEKDWKKNMQWTQYEWPLFSLQPSINRVKKYDEIGKMSNDPTLWPVTFEFLYGLKFIEKGCIKATLKESAFKRDFYRHFRTY